MANTNPAPTPTPYGAHIPFNIGYDARVRQHVRRPKKSNASGYLLDPDGNIFYLWITQISATFGVSGQVGQSRMLREWFPRSFNDVVITVTGNAPSTQDYNGLATFIRVAQWKALQRVNAGTKAQQTIRFVLHDKTPPSWGPRNQRRRINEGPEQATVAGVKGSHRPWKVDGYVRSIRAGANRWEVAPEYSFDFIVAQSHMSATTGIWGDSLFAETPLKDILQILGSSKAKNKIGSGFVRDPIATPGGQLTHGQTKVAEKGLWSARGAVEKLNTKLLWGF